MILKNITQFRVLLALVLASFLILLGAFAFEYLGQLHPCPLCLQQRYAYYGAILVGTAALLGQKPFWIKLVLKLLAVVFLCNMWLGVYHAGAEWGFWAGPTSCAGAGQAALHSVQDLLRSLPTTKVIDCTAVQWRLFGLSLAGYNALLSAALALFAFIGVMQKK